MAGRPLAFRIRKRSEDTPERRAELIEAARAQLRRYAGDARVREHLGPAHLHALVLLYSGWELVQREALDLAAEAS